MYLKIYYRNNVRIQPLTMVSGTSDVTFQRIGFNQKKGTRLCPQLCDDSSVF